MHEIRGELLGLNNYLVLVGMKGLSEKLHEAFYKFARAHRFVTHCSYEVGVWDYMLGVAATRQREVNDLVELLHQHFGDYISSVRSIPMFRARKIKDYPFDPQGHAALWECAA